MWPLEIAKEIVAFKFDPVFPGEFKATLGIVLKDNCHEVDFDLTTDEERYHHLLEVIAAAICELKKVKDLTKFLYNFISIEKHNNLDQLKLKGFKHYKKQVPDFFIMPPCWWAPDYLLLPKLHRIFSIVFMYITHKIWKEEVEYRKTHVPLSGGFGIFGAIIG